MHVCINPWKYIDLGPRPLSIYFHWVDRNMNWPHQKDKSGYYFSSRHHHLRGSWWSWSYGNLSWIYNYLCNQCTSPLTLWVRIPIRRCVLDTTLYDEVCQWLAGGGWLSPGILVSSTNNWPPRYNGNIVKSGVKHHNPNP